VPAGTWTAVFVPLSDLGSPGLIARTNLQEAGGAAQPTFYLDELRLVSMASPPPPSSDKFALWQDGPHLRGANIH
jgi:hypothetical protein